MAHTPPTSRSAFTLIEILIAASIFAVGLVAVASIFPTAIQLQKQTFEEIRGDEFSKTVTALVMQRGFDERLLAQRADDVVQLVNVSPTQSIEPPQVFSSPLAVRGDATPPLDGQFGSAAGWAMTDRSGGSLETVFYTNGAGAPAGVPADIAAPTPTAAGTAFEYAGRNLFWTPLFIDYNPTVADPDNKPAVFDSPTGNPDPRANRNWGAYLFVMRADPKANYTRPVTGDVIDYALSTPGDVSGITLDLPQDKNLDTAPSQVAAADPFLKVPGVVRLDVNINVVAGRHRFEFVNGVSGAADPQNPIVRAGDVVLAENGLTYTVAEILPGANDGDSSQGVVVDGFIADRDQNPVNQIWAAHPGDSGESSFVRLIQFVHEPGEDNLIR